jgi:ornithine decarboxylase
MPTYQRLLRRFLPAELAGTACALFGAWMVQRVSASPWAAGWGGSIGEFIGYYCVIVIADVRRNPRAAGETLARTMTRVLPGILVEFGPAEVLDSLVVRPLLMGAGPLLTGDLVSGTVLGKLAADVVFYALVVPGNWLRRHLAHRRTAPPSYADDLAGAPPTTAGRPETPYLEMDLDRVDQAYQALRAALPEATVHYAMKCNPDRAVLARMNQLGARFEIASATELFQLQQIGVDPREVLFSNPVKIPRHVRSAWTAGVWRFAVDSDAELDKIAQNAPGASVYVRLSTTPASSAVPSEGKFGVPVDDAVRLLQRATGHGLRPYGITFHVGSQMTDPAAWQTAIEQSAAVMRRLAADGIRIVMLDLGGGFPAGYDDSDNPDLEIYAKYIRSAVEQHVPYPIDLVVEPGRALVAEAGVMVATVIGIAERGGTRWAHLDVGAFNGLMEALETGGRLHYPVTDSRESAARAAYHLTGPTCDSQDTVLYDVQLSADLAVGDRVRIGVAGAYTVQYASGFNGFAIPAIHYPAGSGAPAPRRRSESVTPRR